MNIENLALSGGALKGIVYAGCFQAFEEYGIVKNIKKIAGTSIGALFGYGLLLGYTSYQLQEIICKVDYKFLRDVHIDNILSFHNSFGFDTGNRIENAIRVITEKQGLSPEITFEQFHRITGVEFIVVTTCVSKKEKVPFSYKTHPTFPVIKAIRISCGFPIVFNSVTINGEDYADGCLTENTPMSFFMNENDIGKTLGIMLNAKTSKYEHTFSNYIYNVFLCMTETISKLQLEGYSDYILNLDQIKLSSQLNVTQEERKELINYGYTATVEYLETRKRKYEEETMKEENGIHDDEEDEDDGEDDEDDGEDTNYDTQSDVLSEHTIERKKKEFSKLTEQINDILNYD